MSARTLEDQSAPEESPLLNLSLPLTSLETRISRIRSGFSPAARS